MNTKPPLMEKVLFPWDPLEVFYHQHTRRLFSAAAILSQPGWASAKLAQRSTSPERRWFQRWIGVARGAKRADGVTCERCCSGRRQTEAHCGAPLVQAHLVQTANSNYTFLAKKSQISIRSWDYLLVLCVFLVFCGFSPPYAAFGIKIYYEQWRF